MSKAAGKTFRLPHDVRPVNYDLFFDIDLKNFRFSGKESIELEITRPTSRIVMHAAELKVSNAAVNGTKAMVKLEPKKEQLMLILKKSVTGRVRLYIEFAGDLTDNLAGLYRSKYTDAKGKVRYLATTQFEAPYARRAFPCFDEPEHKATYDVALRVSKGLQAISNMPAMEERKEGRKKVIRFQRTPKMSTYLLYLGVGEFEFIEGRLGKVLIRVATVPGKKDQGRLALGMAKKFLGYFQRYSGIPYPLPKLDVIALPDLASMAMENWGAIAFREVGLLCGKATSTAARKRIAEVIAHELWHQWSGNLVTMRWWNDLWLNESFATFMAYKAVDYFFPEWNVWEDFIRERTDSAFDEDSLKATHPIEVEVTDPHQLEEIFDDISYSKGGSVLRMLEAYLGEETFRKGVSKYLRRHKYGNAASDDLWDSLESASKKPIRKIAAAWIRQPGYPLVTAEKRKNVILSQKRFVFNKKDKTCWPIPLAIRTDKELLTDLMDRAKKELVVGNAEWFKLNYGQTGFYRTKYHDENLSKLKTLVAGKHLPAVDRWGLHNDLFRLCRNGELGIDKYLDFIEAYGSEDNYLVLSGIYGSIRSIHFVFSGEDGWRRIRPGLKGLCTGTFKRILDKLGWEPKDKEPQQDALLRGLAISCLGFFEEPDVIRTAMKKFDSYARGGKLHPDIRLPVFFIAAAGGAHDRLLDIYQRSQSPEEKRAVLGAIGQSKDQSVLEKALDFCISGSVRTQDVFTTFSSVAANPSSRGILLGWVSRNWKKLESYKKGHRLFLYILESFITSYVDRAKEKELRRFFRAHPVEYRMTLDKSFERLRRNIFWREKNANILAEYFAV